MASKDKEIEELSKAAVNKVVTAFRGRGFCSSAVRELLRRACPFGPEPTEKQKRIYSQVMTRAMKELEAWPKALAMVALIIGLSSMPALADDQSTKPATSAGVLMQGLNPDGTLNKKALKHIYQVDADGNVVEVKQTSLKEKVNTAFHWTVRKVRRGCQIANPMLQTGAHLAQIAILFVR